MVHIRVSFAPKHGCQSIAIALHKFGHNFLLRVKTAIGLQFGSRYEIFANRVSLSSIFTLKVEQVQIHSITEKTQGYSVNLVIHQVMSKFVAE